MSRPCNPTTLGFGPGAGAADDQLAAEASSPTCRRLLTLLAALTAAHPPAAEANPPRLRNQPAPGPTPRLLAEVQVRLAEHERALQTCDRLEAALVAEFGYPRVWLPGTAAFLIDSQPISRPLRITAALVVRADGQVFERDQSFLLVKENGVWKIDEIIYGRRGEATALHSILKAAAPGGDVLELKQR